MKRSRAVDDRAGSPGAVPAQAVLLVSEDGLLVDELHRLAAAAGASLDVTTPVQARARWASAPLLLIGPDALPALAGSAPPRRPGVHVVTLTPVADGDYPLALTVGAESVVELPAADRWLVEVLADVADGAAGSAPVVAVAGGCGGAGATTFATAMALLAADDSAVTLLDADPWGCGVERVAGLDEAAGTTWATLLQSSGRLGSRSLRASLPRRDRLAVLGWGSSPREELEPAVVREVTSAAQRGSDLVVADLPRFVSPGAAELLQRCDVLVLVSPLTVAAVASTAQVVTRLAALAPRTVLVARGPSTALDPDDVAAVLDVPLAAVMKDQRGLAEAVELGTGPVPRRRGPLARAARATLSLVRAEHHAAVGG